MVGEVRTPPFPTILASFLCNILVCTCIPIILIRNECRNEVWLQPFLLQRECIPRWEA